MVNVTWITPFAPDRAGGGGQIRQAHLLLALAARAKVELICPGPVRDAGIRGAVSRLVELEPSAPDWRGEHRWVRRLADLAVSASTLAFASSPQPMEVRAFRPVRRALRRAMGEPRGDVVLVEFAGLAPLVPGWRSGLSQDRVTAGRQGRWVLTLHNLPSRMADHHAKVMPHRRQRWLLGRDAQAAVAFEGRAAAAFDALIVCTEEDAAALPGTGRVIVVPNGTDADQFQPTTVPRVRRVVFTGALYTTPNIDAARWFCHEVLPLVRAEEPSTEVALVGAGPVAEVRALADLPGVSVHADVEAVGPYLQAARLAVVPIRVGSGSRLKALEAMAAGRPVVGTSIGLEGLGMRAGQHALVADDAAAFAAAVVRVLRDDQLAAQLAAAGRAEVERRFTWPALAAAFTDTILALAKSSRSRSAGGVGPAGPIGASPPDTARP